MPLSNAQWNALCRDISDRSGLKWEWNKIDDEVKLEIRKAWSLIFDNIPSQQKEDNICSNCGRDVSQDNFFAMCDQTGTYCSDCWAQVHNLCLFVHGEGCATKVYSDEKENPNAPTPPEA